MEALRQERRKVFARFALLCNRVGFYRYGVPKSVISELQAFQLPLTAAKSDPELKEEATLYLENLYLVLDYCKALNSGDRIVAQKLREKANHKSEEVNKLTGKKLESGVS